MGQGPVRPQCVRSLRITDVQSNATRTFGPQQRDTVAKRFERLESSPSKKFHLELVVRLTLQSLCANAVSASRPREAIIRCSSVNCGQMPEGPRTFSRLRGLPPLGRYSLAPWPRSTWSGLFYHTSSVKQFGRALAARPFLAKDRRWIDHLVAVAPPVIVSVAVVKVEHIEQVADRRHVLRHIVRVVVVVPVPRVGQVIAAARGQLLLDQPVALDELHERGVLVVDVADAA